MELKTREFTNELGNAIQVRVSQEEVSGVPGICIYMAGPTSMTELMITRQEAEVVLEELQQALGSTQKG